MNAFEKIERAVKLVPPASRQEIPVYGHLCCYAAKLAGMTQAELFSGNDAWIKAQTAAYEKLGVHPDAVFPLGPADISFGEQMKVRVPGKDLPEDEMFQFVEQNIMQLEDYHTIIDHGFEAWQFPYIASIQNPPIPFDDKLFPTVGGRFQELGMHWGQNAGYWAQQGVAHFFHGSCFPAFDLFSLARGLEDFFYDLYDEPELVKEAMAAATPAIINQSLMGAQPGYKICIWAMRSSSTFVSPDMFAEFVWPYMKQIIEAFLEAGVTPVIHCDADWSKNLHFFKELPAGSVIIELDGDTDIEAAYRLLKGSQCIAGDVPATLFSFGTVEEIKDYCEKLVSLAMGGGFIIRNGCEIPLNAKMENVQAFLNCCR